MRRLLGLACAALISLSAFVLGLSTFILLANLVISLHKGKIAGANPWRALTLEWATTSPPPVTNFIDDPIPFPDPYGYGTPASQEYLDDIDRRFGIGEEDFVPRPAPIPAPAPAGD